MYAQRNMEELEKLLASISLSYLHLLPEQATLEIERSLQTPGERMRHHGLFSIYRWNS